MAWVLGVGMVDPRPGNWPNQPMALVQSWAPTSKLWWDLGLRYHPELATKFAKGGGQFTIAEVTSVASDEPSMTVEEGAAHVLAEMGEANPEYAEMLRQIRDTGSDEDRAKLAAHAQNEIRKLAELVKFIQPPKE
jgi:hypothetical protein